jgi:hypothetical protein
VLNIALENSYVRRINFLLSSLNVKNAPMQTLVIRLAILMIGVLLEKFTAVVTYPGSVASAFHASNS